MSRNHVTYLSMTALEENGERIIEGWATTPTEDSSLDVVNPRGAEFSLPLPLLFSHK